jgi:uncharacterized protein with PIN domain
MKCPSCKVELGELEREVVDEGEYYPRYELIFYFCPKCEFNLAYWLDEQKELWV